VALIGSTWGQGISHSLLLLISKADKRSGRVQGTNVIRNLGSIVQLIFQISTILFDQPRRVFAESVTGLGKFDAQ